MVRNSRPRNTVLLVVSLLLIFSSSCSLQDIQSDTGGRTSEQASTPRYLGFVDDPAGEPVAFALVGGTELSTWEGVASGEFVGNEGGWLPVESMGYATGYAYLFPTEDDFPYFSTTLTPFQSLYWLEADETVELIGFQGEDFRVTAEVSGEMFQELPGFVGLTAIDPLNIKPRYTDSELEKGLRVQQAIALQAFSEAWTPLELAPGASVQVRLEFNHPPSPSLSFAVFDPDYGVWREIDPGCTNLDPNTYTCELTFLTPLLAVFDFPLEPVAIEGQSLQLSGFSLSSLLSSLPFFQEGGGDGGSGSVGGIIDQIMDWLLQQQENSDWIDPDDPALKNLIDKLIKAALDQAAKNRNESGKKTLTQAMAVIQAVGQPGASAALEAEMAKISDEIGKKALTESDCGEFRKILKAAEQIERAGGSMQLHDQLTNKASEMAEDCDIWTGHITVSLWATSNHPSGLPMTGGGGSWTESHSVQIWTNVDDYVMHGESKVAYSFPTTTYVKVKECKSQIQMSGSSGKTSIFFEGIYDGYTFQVNSVSAQGGASIKQHWLMTSKDDDTCKTDLDQEFSFSPYYSLIVHGVSSDSPPIDIQEILDSSSVTSTLGADDSLSGTEQITNPDPDLGIYPWRKGFITWNLMHYQKKLPLEEK